MQSRRRRFANFFVLIFQCNQERWNTGFGLMSEPANRPCCTHTDLVIPIGQSRYQCGKAVGTDGHQDRLRVRGDIGIAQEFQHGRHGQRTQRLQSRLSPPMVNRIGDAGGLWEES